MQTEQVLNGVQVNKLGEMVQQIQGQPSLAKFRFRVRNKWINCGQNKTAVMDFEGMGGKIPHADQFNFMADEPRVLLGEDRAPNPVEYLLGALVSCITSSMVYHAAVRGITISELESSAEGEMDVQGFMGISDLERKGFKNINVTFKVKSDGPREMLETCARFSPVLDMVSNGTRVNLKIEPKA